MFFEVFRRFMKGAQKMYCVFEQLLQKYGVSTYKVSKETGIAQSVFSSWKTGKSTPKMDKMQKIADYFGVDVDYLLTGNREPEKPAEEIIVSDKDNRFSIHFRNGKTMSQKDKQMLKTQIENTIDLFYKLRGIE